jgi:GT2 family glycosyltransferase
MTPPTDLSITAQNKVPATSIVMVSYHTGPVLFEAITAVLEQTTPTELCLVDNGNPPDVVTRLLAMAATDPRLHIVSGYGNIGFSRGCNTGARMAKGRHLLFLNPDSILKPNCLDQLARHAESLPPHSMIGARLMDEAGIDQRGCRRALLTPGTVLIEALHLGRLFPNLRLNFNHAATPTVVTPMPAISGAFMFLRREDFWNIGGFDEGYFLHVEDLDLCLRFTRAGGTIYFAPDIQVTHIGGTSAATTGFIEKHKARGFVRYFQRNFGDQYPAPVLWLLNAAVWLRAGMKIALAKIR